MKKIVFLGLVFALFTTAVSAQQENRGIGHRGIQKGFATGQLNRGEKFKLQRNQARYDHSKRRAFSDGRLSPMEKRKLYTLKRHDRRETFRFRHNDRRRGI